MPVVYKSFYDLPYDQVSFEFPISKLAGQGCILGPGGGVGIIAGVDYPGHPGTEVTVQVFSHIGNCFALANGGASCIVGANADANGDLTFLDSGVTKHLWDGRIRLASPIGDLGKYWIVLGLGNNIPSEPIIPVFNGTPPPPTKPSKPIVIIDDPTDEWGLTSISWTTSDNIADLTGFRINRYDSRFPGVPSVRGVTFADAVVHPNYEFNDYIGSEEYDGTFTYTVEPYKLDTPDNTLGAESDPSDPVVFDPGVDPPPEPDIEFPDPDEVPTLSPEGLSIGVGYGGFNLGGAATMVFIQNPSGIYTLVKNKRHDTLYERMTGITSVDMKIPDPFIRTGFVGE